MANGRNRSKRSGGKRRSKDLPLTTMSTGSSFLHGIGSRLRPHTFVRTQTFSIAKNALDSGYAYQLFLSGLPGVTEFTNLYDQYRILRAEVKLVLATPSISSAYPRITTVVDYDDSVSPTSENDVLQYPNAKVYQYSPTNVEHSFEFVPRAAGAMFQGITTGYSMAPAGTWLDGGYPDIPHYGFKFFANSYNSTTTPNAFLTCYVSYQVQMKNAR